MPTDESTRALARASPLLLLDADAMSELYKHVPVKAVLRLVCRATRAGHPGALTSYVSDVVGDWGSLRLACGVGGLVQLQQHGAIVRQVVKGGYLYVLTKAIDAGSLSDNKQLLKGAARHGHLHILRWLVAHRVTRVVTDKGRGFTLLLKIATKHGHLKVVRWWVEENNWHIRRRDYEPLMVLAIESGSLELAQLLHTALKGRHGLLEDHYLQMVNAAGQSGNLELFMWAVEAYEEVFGDITDAYMFAVQNLPMLQWLFDRNVSGFYEPHLCGAAMSCGKLDTVRWLRSKGCPWDADACAYAARRGDLATLQWARATGAPWTRYTLYCAAQHAVHTDDPTVFDWALAAGAPWQNQPVGGPKDPEIRISPVDPEVLAWANARAAPQ